MTPWPTVSYHDKPRSLLAAIRECDASISLANSQIVLKNARQVPTGLLTELKEHKEALVAVLSAPLRDWLWPCEGSVTATHRYAELPEDLTVGVETAHPGGAWWWRWQGEVAWQCVPRRAGTLENLPASERQVANKEAA